MRWKCCSFTKNYAKTGENETHLDPLKCLCERGKLDYTVIISLFIHLHENENLVFGNDWTTTFGEINWFISKFKLLQATRYVGWWMMVAFKGIQIEIA